MKPLAFFVLLTVLSHVGFVGSRITVSLSAISQGASPPGRQGEVVGVRTTMINTSQTFLPLAFGAVGAALGMAPILWTMAVALLVGSWLASKRRMKQR